VRKHRKPSQEAQDRIAEQLRADKEGTLSAEERAELDRYLELEHVPR
jgi:hypothetical protein